MNCFITKVDRLPTRMPPGSTASYTCDFANDAVYYAGSTFGASIKIELTDDRQPASASPPNAGSSASSMSHGVSSNNFGSSVSFEMTMAVESPQLLFAGQKSSYRSIAPAYMYNIRQNANASDSTQNLWISVQLVGYVALSRHSNVSAEKFKNYPEYPFQLDSVSLPNFLASLDLRVTHPSATEEELLKSQRIENITDALRSFEAYHENSDDKSLLFYSTAPALVHSAINYSEIVESIQFESALPHNLPPTHSGGAFKISYKLIVGIKDATCSKVSFFRMPFRLLNNLDGLDADDSGEFDLLHPVIGNDISVSDPPLEHDEFDEDNLLDSVSSLNLKSNVKPVKISVKNNGSHIADVQLSKQAFFLGEPVVMWFDFSRAETICFQVTAILELVEEVQTDFSRVKQPGPPLIQHVSEHHEVVYNTENVGITLSIPPNMSPSFKTTAVHVNWILNVTFILADKPTALAIVSDSTAKNFVSMGPEQTISVSHATWRFPLNIQPTSVSNAAIYGHRYSLNVPK